MILTRMVGDVKKGIVTGEKIRELFTEIRRSHGDPWSVDDPKSPIYERAQEIDDFLGSRNFLKSLGTIIGRMKSYKEFRRNYMYLYHPEEMEAEDFN